MQVPDGGSCTTAPGAAGRAATGHESAAGGTSEQGRLLGYAALRMRYLQRTEGGRDYNVFNAWLLDRDLRDPEQRTLDVQALLTRDQLSDLHDILRACCRPPKRGLLSPQNVPLNELESGGTISRDPQQLGSTTTRPLRARQQPRADLGFMRANISKDLPYTGEAANLSLEDWGDLAADARSSSCTRPRRQDRVITVRCDHTRPVGQSWMVARWMEIRCFRWHWRCCPEGDMSHSLTYFDARGGADLILKALGRSAPVFESAAALTSRSFLFACPKETNQKKAPDLPSPMASAQALVISARELAPAVAQTCTRFIRKSLRCSAASNGTGARSPPPWCNRGTAGQNRSARTVWSPSPDGQDSATPVFGPRGAGVGAQRRPSRVAVSSWLLFFGQAKKGKRSAACAQRFQTNCRRASKPVGAVRRTPIKTRAPA